MDLIMVMLFCGNLFAQINLSTAQYHKIPEVKQVLKDMQQKNQASTRLHTVAASPGGEPVIILEIGSNLKNVPAVFVGANFEGNVPLATEGALRLISMLFDSTHYTRNLKWYIMPQPNPDAAGNFFSDVKYGRTVNDFEINNDADDAVNEDGFNDLNNDGYITQIRVRSLSGTHIISKSDPRLMVRADEKKGERGEFNLYSEGIDDDNDGEYNEDGEGGINVGIAFPHLFQEKNKEAGLWPGQTPEVYGILRFIFDRPEIAMVFTLGSSDFCIAPPEKGRKGDISYDKIKIPVRYARIFNVDENLTYPMDKVMEMVKAHIPDGTDFTPEMVAGLFGLGTVVNPLEDDLRFYSRFSNEYKKYLSFKNFSINNLKPPPAKDGSFELWAYYHLGVPSFSMNLFTVPMAKEKIKEKNEIISPDNIKKMNRDEFIAIGEENIAILLENYNATELFTAVEIMEKVKEGFLTPEQIMDKLINIPQPEKESSLREEEKALLAWSDREWNGNGFTEWKKYQHPELGEVEIGGFIPYIESTPKAEHIDSLLNIKIPWLFQLTKKLSQISIVKEELTDLGSGIFKLEVYIENQGYLPYPIAMGQRNNQPAPVVVVLNGNIEILEGLKRTPLRTIGGNQVKKLTWLLKSEKRAVISAGIESAVFPEEVKQIKTSDGL